MANMTCVRCLTQFEQRLPTGGYPDIIEGVSDRPRPAFVVYRGDSLCAGHFNTERGHPVNFCQYPEKG